MASDKQIQKAGDNAQQFQADSVNVTIINGIDEKRAREVYSEMSARAIQDCTEEATTKAIERIARFEQIVIPRIEQIESNFKSFAEPSFQFLLKSAQKTAACTEREADYQMLSELLVHRIEKGEDRKIKASISRAVEIVDQIDDDALCGLTLVQAIKQWVPVSGSIVNGLNVLNDLLGSLCYRTLPSGFDWVYHLDLLNAARVSSLGTFKKIEVYYPEIFDGYVCIGIQKESENYTKAVDLLSEVNLSSDFLIDHELLEGYVRIPTRSKDSISDIMISTQIPNTNIIVQRKIKKEEIDAVEKIWKLYEQKEDKKRQVKSDFMKKWDSYNSLKEIKTWWNALPHSFDITTVGKVLAHANAKRYNSRIPDLNP